MAEKKKNIFERADAFLERICASMESILAPDVPESEKEKKARLAWEAERQEEKRKEHEEIMKQKGMKEFMDVFNSAKNIDVVLDKFYNPSWPLFEESASAPVYKIGKYEVRGFGVYVDNKHELSLDKDLLTMVKDRAKKLNPKGVEKCEQDAKKWNGKQKFILARGKEK